MSDDYSPLAGFSGTARLFPLPNLVFFPQVMQPLHIFEPRYRQMTADALAGDRMIALVLPRPGWETSYSGAPALHPVACLGKIVAEQKMDDGCYNILLRGLSRVQIAQEIAHGKHYRKAKVELLVEVPIGDARAERRRRKHLLEKVPAWFGQQAKIQKEFRKLLRSDLSLGSLCDIISFALPLDVEFKQTLLEELEVEQRLELLLENLENKTSPPSVSGQTVAAASAARKFPPEFSAN